MSEQVPEPEPGNYSRHLNIRNNRKWKLFHYHNLRGLFTKPNGKSQFLQQFNF